MKPLTLRKKVGKYCEVAYSPEQRRWILLCEGAFIGYYDTYGEAVRHAREYEPSPPTEPQRSRR